MRTTTKDFLIAVVVAAAAFVAYLLLGTSLLSQLVPANMIYVDKMYDDSSAVFSIGRFTKLTHPWGVSGNFSMANGPSNPAPRWRISDLGPGKYAVYATWPVLPSAHKEVPFRVLNITAAGEREALRVVVNQSAPPGGDSTKVTENGRERVIPWQKIGEVTVSRDMPVVVVEVAPKENGLVFADAVRFVAVNTSTPPLPPQTLPSASARVGDVDGNGQVSAADTIHIQRHVTGQVPITDRAMFTRADGNADRKIDATDVLLNQWLIVRKVAALPVRFGDMNRDMQLSGADTTLLGRHVQGTSILPPDLQSLGDLNFDNVLDAKDVELLGRAVVGLITIPVFGPVPPSSAPMYQPLPVPAYCGDGIVQAGVEQCDDRNRTPGDGCSVQCNSENCGDGVVSNGEQCDRGSLNGQPIYDNIAANAACNVQCRYEYCGDGVVQPALKETCDDRNVRPGDGCSNTCTEEPRMSSATFSVSIDGPPSAKFFAGQNDVLLAKLVLASSIQTRVNTLTIAVQANGPNGTLITDTYGFDTVAKMVEGLQLRSLSNGQVYRGVLLTGPADAGKVPGIGAYQLYRFDGLDGNSTYEILAEIISNGSQHPLSGDVFKVHVCGEPATLATGVNPLGCSFGGLMPAGNGVPYQINVMEMASGLPIVNVTPRGTITGNSHTILNPELSLAVKSTGTTNTVAKNTRDVSLLRFEARANEVQDLTIHRLVFNAQLGSVNNAMNYALWADSNGDGLVDTVIESGIGPQVNSVTFNNLKGGSYVIPKNASVIFEVHADIPQILVSNQLQLQFDTNSSAYIEGEVLDTGRSLAGIRLNGACNGACEISLSTTPSIIWQISSEAGSSLYVTKDITPIRTHQLLAGDRGDAIMRLMFRVDGAEDVAVKGLELVSFSKPVSIDRLELFREGEVQAFASATVAACGESGVVTPGTPASMVTKYCTPPDMPPLIIARGTQLVVAVRPFLRTDSEGAVSGEKIILSLLNTAVTTPPSSTSPIRATGVTSQTDLRLGDPDAVAKGEVFIGRSSPGAGMAMSGDYHTVVGSKILSIANANPDADGTSVAPDGSVATIGQFKFTTPYNANINNGRNRPVIDTIAFTVSATNVELDPTSFKIYNKSDTMIKAPCGVLSTLNSAAGQKFIVACRKLGDQGINATIDPPALPTDPPSSSTFGLEAVIRKSQVSLGRDRSLQVTLSGFTNAQYTQFGPVQGQSSLLWVDYDNGPRKEYFWVEYPEESVRSTMYR